MTREADWEAVTAAVVAEHARLDVLVNSAGISFACPVAEMSFDDWRRVLLVNLDGVFLGTKHAVRAMRAAGGSIVNVSSAVGLKSAPGASAYSTSKAARYACSRAPPRKSAPTLALRFASTRSAPAVCWKRSGITALGLAEAHRRATLWPSPILG